jgi:putative transposase
MWAAETGLVTVTDQWPEEPMRSRRCRPSLGRVARVPRSALSGYRLFHVTARGVDRCLIYQDDEDYSLFLRLFRRAMHREEVQAHAYCLMPNHYHAVLEGGIELISSAMRWLNGSYAREFNARHGRSGHLFQERYYSGVVESEAHLGRACEYVWENAVRAGLCASRSEWPWHGAVLLRPDPRP